MNIFSFQCALPYYDSSKEKVGGVESWGMRPPRKITEIATCSEMKISSILEIDSCLLDCDYIL